MVDTESTADVASSETIVEMSRLLGLSDGVFAFALTLLVLDLKLPDYVTAGSLPAILQGLAPKLLVYLVSFVVIGGAWGSHQRMLGQIKRGDGVLVWLNLFSLLFVTLVPACASMLGSFPDSILAIVCFAVDVILIQLSAMMLWRHASHYHLVNPALDPRVVDSVGRRLTFSAVAFTLSIPLALYNTDLAFLIWVVMFALLFATDWLSWQQAIQTERATIALNGAKRAKLVLRHGAGHLKINAGDSEDALLAGVFGGGVKAQVTRKEDAVEAHLGFASRQGLMSMRFPWSWGPVDMLDWTFGLNSRIPIALVLAIGGGQANLDLTELLIPELRLEASASDVTLTLPAHSGQSSVSIEASAASVSVCAPLDLGVRIHVEQAISNVEIDGRRFPATGKQEYQTANYATAANHVDIHFTAALGSLRVIDLGAATPWIPPEGKERRHARRRRG